MSNKPTPAGLTSKQAAKELRRKQQQAQQRLLFAVGAIALLAIVVLVIFLNTRPLEAIVPDEIKTSYAKFAEKGYMGKTAEGYYTLGAENAPVVMQEYSSFSCPHCKDFYEQIIKNVYDKVESGQLKIVYIPLTPYGSYELTGQSKGALCAGVQGKFWEFQALMFDWQSRYGSSSNDARRLIEAAKTMGLDLDKFGACVNGSDMDAVLKTAADLAVTAGVSGTPTVLLDGTKVDISLSTLRGYIELKVKPA